jgi:23S rRNA (cytidine1920-2'-O)/16S rRNA (cytidine1409-2'-O)-methyltransferase
MKRERIDKLLVERGLVETRTRAQAMVMAGIVLVNEQRISKPSDLVNNDASIRLKGADDPAFRFVGRGGIKLEAALREFDLDVRALVCIDVGASTGGFTDVLLQNGAHKVVAVDVGHNQIDYRLRTDPRVEVREGVNARHLSPLDFEEKFGLAVMDVSFISATKVLPAIVPLLTQDARVIVLIKPQFEVGRGEVGKGGVVRDAEKQARVVEEVNQAAEALCLKVMRVMESPIRGAEGNREFLALYQKSDQTEAD